MKTVRTLLGTFVLVVSMAFVPNTPTLEVGTDNSITVAFDKGAVYACTHYENLSLIGDDGKPETLHDCGWIDETQSKYEEPWLVYIPRKSQTWRVYATVGYPRQGDNGVTYVDYVTSNSVKVVF